MTTVLDHLAARSAAYLIAMPSGHDVVDGVVVGLIGIAATRVSGEYWTLTHLPSGRVIVYARSFDEALDLAVALHAVADPVVLAYAGPEAVITAWPSDVIVAMRRRNEEIGEEWEKRS